MDYELKNNDKFIQTFGGESYIDDWKVDDYGFTIGNLTVYNLRAEEFAKLVVEGMNHLMLNRHKFEFIQTNDMDLPIEVRMIK